MFFSIIIPVYNVEKYLRRCVDSVLSQTFTDYEIILVDDGSPDNSGIICDEYNREYTCVQVIHKRNGGLSSARNAGIKAASGEYLLFLDSDDLWNDKNALNELQAVIISEKLPDLVCYGTDLYDEKDQLIKSRTPRVVSGTACERLHLMICRNEYISTAYVKAIKASFIDKNSLYFVNGIFSEDIEWSGRILEVLDSVAVYPKAFCKRICRSEGSITANLGKKNLFDILDSIENAIIRIETSNCTKQRADLCYEYWAYQYAMLLSLASIIKDEPDYNAFIDRLKALKWLLRYDHVKKVRAVNILVKIVGINPTIRVLGIRRIIR